jgi:hypothetical protein
MAAVQPLTGMTLVELHARQCFVVKPFGDI